MKLLPTLTAFAFIAALSTPVLAADTKTNDAAAQESGQAATGDAVAGPVSDKPRNRMQCDEDGGTWNDQSNTCSDAKN